MIFQFKSLIHFTCYILIKTPSQSNIWLQRYDQFFAVQNNVKHKHLSFVFACNSKSIFSRWLIPLDHITYKQVKGDKKVLLSGWLLPSWQHIVCSFTRHMANLLKKTPWLYITNMWVTSSSHFLKTKALIVEKWKH